MNAAGVEVMAKPIRRFAVGGEPPGCASSVCLGYPGISYQREKRMKKFSVILLSALMWLAGSCLTVLDAHADVEWKVKKQLRLKEKPLAVLASLDGQYLYMLVEGRLLIYSLTEGRGKYSIPVDKSLDMITLSEANKLLILASSSEKLVRIVELEFILQLDISELPYQGPKDAPVTITAFIDYQ